MNATKKGSTRAVSGMEQAIAETHARLAAGGSAKDLQQKAAAALESGPRLTTEREGRMFAVEVLERLGEADADAASVYPYGDDYAHSDVITPWRTGPQWDGLQKDLFRIFHEGTEAAQLGFCSIFTCVLAGDVSVAGDYYRKLEKAGKLLPFGTPGTAYPAPKLQRKTKAQRKAERKAALQAKAPVLLPAEPFAIEEFLKYAGPARRAAWAFLAKPYDEMVAAAKSDRKTAEAFAQVWAALKEGEENYMTVVMRIVKAVGDLKRAVSERRDGAALLEIARRAQARHSGRKA